MKRAVVALALLLFVTGIILAFSIQKTCGWDKRGILTKTTLEKLGLTDIAEQLSKHITLTP